MRKRYTTITCIYHQDPGKHYVYKTYLTDLKKGDLVIVECNTLLGFAIVGVWNQYEDLLTRSQATKWAFQKVDVQALADIYRDAAREEQHIREEKEQRARVHRLMSHVIDDPMRREEFLEKMAEFLRERRF